MGNTVKVSVFEQEQDDPAADTHVCLVAQSCPTLCDPMDCSPPHSSVHGILQAGILEWVVMPSPQGIFPTQGSNPGLPHCRQILYHLSHQENPRILEWVAYPFSRQTSWPRNQTGVSCKQADSLPVELSGKPQLCLTPKSLWVHYTARLPKQDWLYKCAFASAMLILIGLGVYRSLPILYPELDHPAFKIPVVF